MNTKIPCSFNMNFNAQSNDKLIPVNIKVLHNNLNRNNSTISLEAIKKAEESIKNSPILAFIEYDENDEAIDFKGHEVETKIKEDEEGNFRLHQRFKEFPVGIIPESTEISYEEEGDKTYFCCTGYIFEGYSNETVALLEETGGKCVSMEISVDEGYFNKKENVYEIRAFTFRGVTILSDQVTPGMDENCRIEISYKDEASEIYSSIKNKKYQMEVGTVDNTQTQEQVVETTEVQETVESTETTEVEETSVETSEETTEVPQNYSLSVENLAISMRKTMSEMTTQKTNRWNETYQVQSYYLRTILPSECIAIVEDGVCDYTYYGVPYSVKGDEVVLDFDNKKEYIQTWREKQTESETIVTFCEKEEDEQKAIEARFSLKEGEIEKLKTQISEQEVELETLRTFKFEKDQEALNEAVSNIVTKFSILEESEYKEIMDKTINGEMSVNDFELHMYAMKGKKQEALELEQAEIAKFSKKDEKSEASRIPVTSHINPEMFSSKGRYGNLEADLVRISGKQD